MWADTLLVAERAHLHLLLLWGSASIGLGLLLLVTAGRLRRSPLIFHFAAQSAVWGGIESAFAFSALRSLPLRDLGAATLLDRLLWLNLGLEIGYVAVGATVAVSAWLLGRRYGGVGAGVAITVQGLALFVLDARFLALLERFV